MEVQAESLHAVSETSSGEPHAHRYLFKAQQRSKRSVLLAGATGAAFAGLLMVAQPASAAPMYYVANLTPLNNSGVFATFNLTVDGNILTVTDTPPASSRTCRIHNTSTASLAPPRQ